MFSKLCYVHGFINSFIINSINFHNSAGYAIHINPHSKLWTSKRKPYSSSAVPLCSAHFDGQLLNTLLLFGTMLFQSLPCLFPISVLYFIYRILYYFSTLFTIVYIPCNGMRGSLFCSLITTEDGGLIGENPAHWRHPSVL